ncbi:hypothetical protein D049_0714B, partial [Vibrio parahaemolyticus VPTS-2010]
IIAYRPPCGTVMVPR